jgi:hypothetical protein
LNRARYNNCPTMHRSEPKLMILSAATICLISHML